MDFPRRLPQLIRTGGADRVLKITLKPSRAADITRIWVGSAQAFGCALHREQMAQRGGQRRCSRTGPPPGRSGCPAYSVPGLLVPVGHQKPEMT